MYRPPFFRGRHVWWCCHASVTRCYKHVFLSLSLSLSVSVQLYTDTRYVTPQIATSPLVLRLNSPHPYATSQCCSLYTGRRHISYRYTVFYVLVFFREHSRHRLWCALEDQCGEYFTSSRLILDAKDLVCACKCQ